MKVIAGLLLCVPALGIVSAEEVERSYRDAVESALPYLEKEGIWWMEEKKCTSCHHTTFFVWAKDLAKEAGFSIDDAILKNQRDWAVAEFLAPVDRKPEEVTPENKDEKKGDRNAEGVSQLLISPSASEIPGSTLEVLRNMVAGKQGDDGNWSPGGQLPRQQRPKEEIQWVSNQWATLALAPGALEKEPQFSGEGSKAKTTEWFAMNAILFPGEDSIQKLLHRQNEDGGWSWKDGEPSSPDATGQALLALGRTGLAVKQAEAVNKARTFLVGTQAEDGRWKNMSTKDRKKSTRVSDFWGTTWAVIGLLETRQ